MMKRLMFSPDVEQVITPIVVTIFFLSWVFISAMVFRNLFIGVMGMSFSPLVISSNLFSFLLHDHILLV